MKDLLAPSGVKGKNQFQLLIEKLHPEHKARWFAGAALNTAEQAITFYEDIQIHNLVSILSKFNAHFTFDDLLGSSKKLQK